MIHEYQNVRLSTELEKVSAFARIYFSRTECFALKASQKEDILGTAKWLVARSPYDPNRVGRVTGKTASINTYAQVMVVNAHRIWRGMQHPSFLKCESFDENYHEDVADPLRVGDGAAQPVARLLDADGDTLTLHAPPYTVRFTSEAKHHDYWENPYFVPAFQLVPISLDKVALRGSPSGRKMSMSRQDLSELDEQTLEFHRLRYGTAIHGLVEGYLRQYGWTSLKQEQRAIISRVNKGMSSVDIMRELSLPRSTYSYRLNRLQSRGWVFEYNLRAGRDMLFYKPILDGKRGLIQSTSMRKLMSESREELLKVLTDSLSERLYDTEIKDEIIEKECGLARDRVLERFATHEMMVEYDRALKAFIKEVVDRPSVERTRIPGTFEGPFLCLPKPRQQALLIGAIRYRRSLMDMFSLVDLFADQIYDNRDEAELTLATLG